MTERRGTNKYLFSTKHFADERKKYSTDFSVFKENWKIWIKKQNDRTEMKTFLATTGLFMRKGFYISKVTFSNFETKTLDEIRNFRKEKKEESIPTTKSMLRRT